jgi:nitrate/TMAO reductase-like tetraheme cytochrome c subunit
MVGEANRSQNDSLKAAAALLNQFVFGTTEFEAAKKLYKETEKDNSAEEKLKKERQEFVQQRYETARNDISSRVDNLIKRTIADNIDPKSSMTDYVRKQASREAFEQIQDLINKDARFKSILDKLWKHSFNSNFSRDSQDKIRRAFITRAKTVLPSAIKKARNEALKGLGKRVKEETDELPEVKEESVSNKPKKLGQSTTPKFSGKTDRDKAKQIPRGMSALDYLMQD